MSTLTAASIRRTAWALLFAMPLAAGAAPAAPNEIRIGGTGNALGAMRQLGEAFVKANPGMRVTMLPSLGSSGAIKAVPGGAVDIGLSSRPLTVDEGTRASSFEYARTPLVFAVSSTSSVKAASLQQLADIYSGKTAAWPDGTQARPVLRQSGDENTRQMRLMSPALDQALTVAEKRPGIPFATSDQEAADKAESVPGAVAATALSLIISEKRKLRALTLDGVEPTAANGLSGKYPHAKRFFLITRADASPAVLRFTAFMLSPPGRGVLAASGHWIP